MESKKFWDKFYKEGKQPTESPSPFAVWFIKNLNRFGMSKKMSLVELGAGCGRDTRLIMKNFKYVDAIDESIENNLVRKLKAADCLLRSYHIIYSRFFLHCLTNKEISNLIDEIDFGTYFVAEFRVKGDKPVLYKDHKRNFIDMGWLTRKLMSNFFEVKYFEVRRGLAKYKNEDPLIGRIIAKKYDTR